MEVNIMSTSDDEIGNAKLVIIITGYKKMLKIIEEHSGAGGICRLNKKEINAYYGLSYSGTLKKIKFLITYGLLIDHKPGLSCTNKNIVKDTPIGMVLSLFHLLSEHTELHNDYKAQAEILEVPHKDIQVAWGFLSYCFGSKYGEV